MNNKKKKPFTGISFSLFQLSLNAFDGYGFSFLNMYYNSVTWVTHSHGGPIFSMNWNKHREKGGSEYRLWVCIFFYGFCAFRHVLVPPQEKCEWCYDDYQKPALKPYCSEECKKYATED